MGSFNKTIAAVMCASSLALTANALAAVSLSLNELGSQAESLLTRQRNSEAKVRRILEDARKKATKDQVTCLERIDASMIQGLQQADEKNASLKTAVARGDGDAARREYEQLVMLHQASQKLDGDANLCAAEMVMPGTQGPVVTHVDSVDVAPGSSVQPLVDPQRYEVENTPPREKVAKANEAVAKMQTTFENAVKKLEDARNSKDVVQLNCTNEKVTQIKGLLRIAEQSGIALKEAVAMIVAVANGQTPPRSAVDTSNDEYLKIVIASNRVTQLGAEAEGCIGQLAFRVDEKVALDVEEPDDLPKNDPSKVLPVSPPPVRGPAASPTM